MSFQREKFRTLATNIPHLWLYLGLIFAFLIKDVGAAWDASYHFIHFRDLFQGPHLLNGFGDVLVLVLLIYLWLIEPTAVRSQLKIILYGLVIFVIAIFFDQWYHLKFGIDLTTWSPSHFMLYTGTFVGILGSFLYILKDYRHSSLPPQMMGIFSVIFLWLILSCLWFPLLQQEQGVITDYYLRHGVRLADPELLNSFFYTQHDVYSGLPGWLYGAWAVLSIVFTFKLTKLINLYKFGATIVAGLYLLDRFIMNTIFDATKYPLSALPYFVIIVALAFDILYNSIKKEFILRDVVSSAAPLAGVIILGLFNPEFPIHPPIPMLETFLFAIPGAVLGYFSAVLVYNLLFSKVLHVK